MEGFTVFSIYPSRVSKDWEGSTRMRAIQFRCTFASPFKRKTHSLLVIYVDPAQALNVPIVPLGAMLTAVYSLTSRPPYSLAWLNHMISTQDIMDPDLLKKLVLKNFSFKERGLSDRSGTFFYQEHIHKINVPILVVASDQDAICPLKLYKKFDTLNIDDDLQTHCISVTFTGYGSYWNGRWRLKYISYLNRIWLLLEWKTETTREEGQHGISAATGISDLEQVLQQKTFTRSEIERLKAFLHSRSNESSSRANLYSSPSSKVALRQDLVLHNNATGFLKSPNTLIAPKIANGFTTPRSRGRSAMYSMARTPYARSPSTFTRKGITSSYGREEALTSSRSTFQHGGKMCFHALCHALKRRSSVLDDDIGSGGSLRRTRQKANLALKHRELGYTALQQPDHASQKLLLMNESEPKIVKGAEKKRDTSMHGSGSVSGYANVPTKSTQTATKILQHLEEVDLKEKSSGSTKSPPILTLDIAHSRELTSKGTEKVEDNGPTAEPLQKKCAFQMSVPEDDSFEIDDDDETQVLGESCKQETALAADIVANIFGKSESKDGKGNDEKAANIFGNLDAPASTALPGTPTNGISTTTTRTLAAIFSTSTPTPVIPSSVPTLVFGFGFATSTTPTISVAETGNTSVTNDKDLKSNSPFASTPFSTTTTTTGSGLFGSSSLAVTSTTKNQSLASFFNVSNGSQANTQASVAVTPSVPSLFGSGTTSIPSSTSGTSPFSSSAFTIGTSSSFSNSSMTASLEGKYGNSTSGPATSIFGSTWDPTKSFRFGTTYNFGASATPTPSATTSPVVFGASSTRGSTKYSFGAGAGPPSSFSTPTQNQSPLTLVFGNSTSGPATSIFGSTWDPAKSSRFYNFGVSATPTPSGTTSIPSSTSGTSHFSSSAFTIGTSSSFSISSMTASSEGKYGNSTSGPATSIFGSTWDPEKSSGFGTNHMSMDGMEEDSMQTPTPVFDTSVDSMVAEDSHVFGTGATTNNYDDMSMDGMVEDCMQTPTLVPAFGQTSVALPPFTFDSGTQPPFVQLCPHPDWWPAKTDW
ncbi:hypothetical protein Tco_0417027 [Tanacetum coccineum]